MTDLTADEIEKIVKAMSQDLPLKEPPIPMKAKGSYGPIANIALTHLDKSPTTNKPSPREQEERIRKLQADIEVYFGKTKMSVKEISTLQAGDVIQFDELKDEPVTLVINGEKVGRGEIVTVDGAFGIRILSLEKN